MKQEKIEIINKIKELKHMVYLSKSPQMDNSHILDTHKADKLLNEIYLAIKAWNTRPKLTLNEGKIAETIQKLGSVKIPIHLINGKHYYSQNPEDIASALKAKADEIITINKGE